MPNGENFGGSEINEPLSMLLDDMNFFMLRSSFTKSLNLFFIVTFYFSRITLPSDESGLLF